MFHTQRPEPFHASRGGAEVQVQRREVQPASMLTRPGSTSEGNVFHFSALAMNEQAKFASHLSLPYPVFVNFIVTSNRVLR